MCADRVDAVRAWADGIVAANALPVIDLVVARRGVVVLRSQHVSPLLSDAGLTLPTPPLFYLASFTKVFVATLIMQQIERGTLALDRPIAEYLPRFGQWGKDQVTVRHLLCHASGLPDELSSPLTAVKSNEDWLKEIYASPLFSAPGSRCSYCTWGFIVLAELLRQLTGSDLERLARREIFDPLEMSNTHFGYEAAWREQVVPLFESAGETLVQSEELNCDAFLSMNRGDIGAYSTADDVAVFCQTALNGGAFGSERILSPVTLERMTEPQFAWTETAERLSAPAADQFVHLSKGLGWMVRGQNLCRGSDFMSPRAFFHGGLLSMRAIVDPAYDLVTVFLTSMLATAPAISAIHGDAARIHHTFGTLAHAAITEL